MRRTVFLLFIGIACASAQDLEALLAAKTAQLELQKKQAAVPAAAPLATPRTEEAGSTTTVLKTPAEEKKTSDKPSNGGYSVKPVLARLGIRLDKTRSFGPVVGPEGQLSVGNLVVGKFQILSTKHMTFPGVFNSNGRPADEVLVVTYKAIPSGRYFYMFCLPKDEPGIPVGAIITPRSWCPMKVIYCKDQTKPICVIPPAGFLAGPND